MTAPHDAAVTKASESHGRPRRPASRSPVAKRTDAKHGTIEPRAASTTVLLSSMVLGAFALAPVMLSNDLIGLARLRITEALDCLGDNEKLAVDHHAEIAAVLGGFVCFFGAVGAWAGAHCRSRKKSAEYVSRVGSYVHAVGSSVLCFLVLADRHLNGYPYDSPTSCQEGFALVFSLAYFFVDTIGIITGDFFDAVFLLHHVACISCIAWSIMTGHAGRFLTLVVWCMEVTNPFMQAHWMNVFDKRTRGHWYNVNRFGFIVLFAFVRGCIGPWLIYTSYNIPSVPLPMVGVGCAFFVFSMRALSSILQSEMKGELWMC